jgi:tol-pal system protein YbgF
VDQLAILSSDVNTLKSEVSDLKKEMASLKEINKPLRKNLAKLSLRIDDIKTDIQELRGQGDENQHALQKKLRGMEERVARLEQNKPTPSTSAREISASLPIPPSPPEAPRLLDPEELYANAYSIYKNGRYPDAREAFLKFLHQFPQTEFSDNAQFWVGECYYREEEYEKAILAYEEVVKKYPQGNKVPDALLKQGICFRVLGDKTSSQIILQRVIENYSNLPQAEIARKELEKSS